MAWEIGSRCIAEFSSPESPGSKWPGWKHKPIHKPPLWLDTQSAVKLLPKINRQRTQAIGITPQHNAFPPQNRPFSATRASLGIPRGKNQTRHSAKSQISRTSKFPRVPAKFPKARNGTGAPVAARQTCPLSHSRCHRFVRLPKVFVLDCFLGITHICQSC